MAFQRSTLTFHRETFAGIIGEARPLLQQHWKEIALNQNLFALDPDESFYRGMERAASLRIFTARENGVLVGYAVYFVRQHPHYKSVLWAVSDIFWMRKTSRATRGWWQRMARRVRYWLRPSLLKSTPGIRFFCYIEDQLRSEGVDVMHTTYKTNHPAAGRVLRYLGHRHIEAGFAKVLRG